jgi:hypothetical protein
MISPRNQVAVLGATLAVILSAVQACGDSAASPVNGDPSQMVLGSADMPAGYEPSPDPNASDVSGTPAVKGYTSTFVTPGGLTLTSTTLLFTSTNAARQYFYSAMLPSDTMFGPPVASSAVIGDSSRIYPLNESGTSSGYMIQWVDKNAACQIQASGLALQSAVELAQQQDRLIV